MSLTFEEPLWLLALLAVVPIIWTGVRWLGAMTRTRAATVIAARVILLTLIVFALGGAAAVRTSHRLAVVAVVDVSDSVRQFADFGEERPSPGAPPRRIGFSDAATSWLQRASAAPDRGPEDLLGVVVFDGKSIALATPQRGGGGELKLPTLDYHIAEGTNIEHALRFASSIIPPGATGRIVLITDGDETTGDSLGAAKELATGIAGRPGLPVDVLPVTYTVKNEVMIEAVDVPPAPSESSVTVRVVLNATDPATGTLELLYEGKPLDLNGPDQRGTGRKLSLKPGRTVELIDVKLGPGAIHRLEPVFVADNEQSDRIASNNRAQAFVVSPGKGAVLILDGVSNADPAGPGATLGETLSAAGIETKAAPPGELPDDLLSLQAYDLIILQNIPAEAIPRASHTMLADYVRDMGGGLVMIGGPDSLGAGGWKGTDLEPILPVKLDLPEQLITPSAAVMLVLDCSGSMRATVMGGSRSQQEIANEGAALAVETLDKNDLIGVLAFNWDYKEVVPLGKNTDPKRTAERIRAIGAGGGTNLYPAMAKAKADLMGVKATVKHIIILTDGRSEGEPEEGLRLASEMRDSGISVSTIAVGDEADTATLAGIAKAGKGQYYQVIDPNLLPRIFIKEIRVVRKPLIRESPFTPLDTRSGSPMLTGVPRPIPKLHGLVLTQARADPKVTNALVTPDGEPVLAHWRIGRGQAAVFTSDAHDAWARDWINGQWPGYAAIWTRLARAIARPPGDRATELVTDLVGDELRIRLDAVDDNGRPMGELNVPGFVSLPGGQRVEVTLGQTGPGTYEARIPAIERGNYVVALAPSAPGGTSGEKPLAPIWGGATRAIGPEFARLSSNAGLLKQIAEETGGRLLSWNSPETAHLWDRANVQPSRASLPLWPALIAWSLVVFLLDVGTRRVAWDRLISRGVAAEIRHEAAAQVRRRVERAAATVASLRDLGDRKDQPIPTRADITLPDRRDIRVESAPIEAAELEESPAERDERLAREREAEESRRKRLREQMLRRIATGGLSAESPDAGHPSEKAEPESPAPRSGDLLAAKKRARDRFNTPGE